MTGKLIKLQKLFNKLFEIITTTFLFMVSNLLFFQVFFMIDFSFVFLPLYFVCSLTLLPSSFATIRLFGRLRKEPLVSLLSTYWEELKQCFCEEFKYLFIITLGLFTTITALYISETLPSMAREFYFCNLLLLGIEILYLIEVIGCSLVNRGERIFFQAVKFLGKDLYRQVIFLSLLFLTIKLITVNFSLILISFGALFYLLFTLYSVKTIN